MIIGIDFDNTIVSYETIFYSVALERGLIPASTPKSKKAVRDYLRSIGNESAWTEMQGYVYGERVLDAEPFNGIVDFFIAAKEMGHTLFIISHKTKHPFLGPKYDLHAAARGWLEKNRFFSQPLLLPNESVFFELELNSKLDRIASCNCDVFIDDLPELLNEPKFPTNTKKILFDPFSEHISDTEGLAVKRFDSWSKILKFLQEDAA